MDTLLTWWFIVSREPFAKFFQSVFLMSFSRWWSRPVIGGQPIFPITSSSPTLWSEHPHTTEPLLLCCRFTVTSSLSGMARSYIGQGWVMCNSPFKSQFYTNTLWCRCCYDGLLEYHCHIITWSGTDLGTISNYHMSSWRPKTAGLWLRLEYMWLTSDYPDPTQCLLVCIH